MFAIVGLNLTPNETGLEGDIDLTVQKQEFCVHVVLTSIFPGTPRDRMSADKEGAPVPEDRGTGLLAHTRP